MCDYLDLKTLLRFAKATVEEDRILLSDYISYIPKLATTTKTICFQFRKFYYMYGIVCLCLSNNFVK